MPQSLAQIYLHLVFSTKFRKPFLQDKTFRSRLHAYLAGICNNHECPSLITGGVDDHVHLLFRFSKILHFADLVRDLKRDSTKWIHSEKTDLADFGWQAGYGVFSISATHVVRLKVYIQGQEELHRHESFQDEFRRICQKNGAALDEPFAWD